MEARGEEAEQARQMASEILLRAMQSGCSRSNPKWSRSRACGDDREAAGSGDRRRTAVLFFRKTTTGHSGGRGWRALRGRRGPAPIFYVRITMDPATLWLV
jgi:hypothetical protein